MQNRQAPHRHKRGKCTRCGEGFSDTEPIVSSALDWAVRPGQVTGRVRSPSVLAVNVEFGLRQTARLDAAAAALDETRLSMVARLVLAGLDTFERTGIVPVPGEM